ncbi:unnamed protein product [Choristocarpus tenellus]
MREAADFDPFFANACVGCGLRLVDGQGLAMAEEMVKAKAAGALVPLLRPRFELTRMDTLALLAILVEADREGVCTQIVGYPAGMQTLVDLLDDR